MARSWRRAVLPAAILVAGGLGFFLLAGTRTPPRRVERPRTGPLVEVVEAPSETVVVTVAAQGTVRPAREIDLVPQVAGPIVWMNPALEAGGFFAADQVLARIDDVDYRLAAQQAAAEVARSRQQLAVARSEAEVARQEWDLLHAGDPQPPAPLVLRLPQLHAAEAALAAAEARRAQARLNLRRTELRAPFAGRVRATAVDLGQYVTPGRAVARIYGTDKAEVVVPVADDELGWLEVPGVAGGPAASPPVTLWARYAGVRQTWSGRLVRSEGQIDPRSRTVDLVVEVDAPYAGVDRGRAPLVVGLFVDALLRGRAVAGVRRVPRHSLHEGNSVWLAGADGRLRVRQAQVVRAGRDSALVRYEAEAGQHLVITQLRGVTDGMRVRVVAAAGVGD